MDETEEVAGNNESQATVDSLEPLVLRAAASGDRESLSDGDFDDDENEEQPASSSSSSSSAAFSFPHSWGVRCPTLYVAY